MAAGDSGIEDVLEGSAAVRYADNDPENTMFVALTMRDLAAISFGLKMLWRLYPELSEELHETAAKLNEIGHAQDFLHEIEEEAHQDG